MDNALSTFAIYPWSWNDIHCYLLCITSFTTNNSRTICTEVQALIPHFQDRCDWHQAGLSLLLLSSTIWYYSKRMVSACSDPLKLFPSHSSLLHSMWALHFIRLLQLLQKEKSIFPFGPNFQQLLCLPTYLILKLVILSSNSSGE